MRGSMSRDHLVLSLDTALKFLDIGSRRQVLRHNPALAQHLTHRRVVRHMLIRNRRLALQVLRSGTSVGANITEGHYGASKADFINKYVIAEKEAGETLYWLRLLVKSGYLEDVPATQSLLADCDELIRLLASSIKTARSKN